MIATLGAVCVAELKSGSDKTRADIAQKAIDELLKTRLSHFNAANEPEVFTLTDRLSLYAALNEMTGAAQQA